MSPRVRAQRAVGVGALLAAMLTLAGCGGSGDPTGDPGPSEPTAASSSADESPSAESTWGSAPATGLRMETPVAAAHAPDGWVQGAEYVKTQKSAEAPDGSSYLTMIELPAAPSSLEDAARRHIRYASYTNKPSYDGTEVVNGIPMWVVSVVEPDGMYDVTYGAIYGDRSLSFSFFLHADLSEAEKQQVVESTLASVEWK